ncbi:MAG: hypothetical protein J6Q94_05925 [Clostridia bacterium]|nr:hypothetical protein [Clostridia bacterium]
MSIEENKTTKKASSYSKSSSDGKIVGLLVGILAVGICLLGVSVAGMVNVSKAPVAETTTTPIVQNDQYVQNDVPVVNDQNVATTAPQNTDAPATPDSNNSTPSNTSAPQTDAEWLAFFNTALNKLKTDGPALTKEKQVVTSDIKLSNPLGNSVVSVVKDQLLSEELITTPIAKGDKAAAIANISPDGKNYVSTLTMSDIKSITHKTDSNGNYVITINAPEMTNPEVSGPYGKVFIFLTVDEVMDSYAPDIGATVERSKVKLLFSDCSATATISPDGKVVAYETTLNINMILQDAKIAVITTDVDAKLLSHTEYKNIVW